MSPAADPPQSALARMRIHVDQELHELHQQIGGVLEQVRQLGEVVDRIAKTVDAAAPAGAIWWPDLDAVERDKRMGELAEWVDGVFRTRYPDQAKQLAECWLDHPAMIDAVTAGWLAWIASYKAPGKLTGPITWQADPVHGMPAMLKALAEAPCGVSAHQRRR